MSVSISGWLREMLRAEGPEHWRDPGGQDRAQVAAGEAAPAREDGAGDHSAQGALPRLRGQAVHLLRGLKLCLHHTRAVSEEVAHGAAQAEEGSHGAGDQVIITSNKYCSNFSITNLE